MDFVWIPDELSHKPNIYKNKPKGGGFFHCPGSRAPQPDTLLPVSDSYKRKECHFVLKDALYRSNNSNLSLLNNALLS